MDGVLLCVKRRDSNRQSRLATIDYFLFLPKAVPLVTKQGIDLIKRSFFNLALERNCQNRIWLAHLRSMCKLFDTLNHFTVNKQPVLSNSFFSLRNWNTWWCEFAPDRRFHDACLSLFFMRFSQRRSQPENFFGQNTSTLSEQHYFIWHTVSQSAKRQSMLEISAAWHLWPPWLRPVPSPRGDAFGVLSTQTKLQALKLKHETP